MFHNNFDTCSASEYRLYRYAFKVKKANVYMVDIQTTAAAVRRQVRNSDKVQSASQKLPNRIFVETRSEDIFNIGEIFKVENVAPI